MPTSRSRGRSRPARRLSWLVVLALTAAALFAPGVAPVAAASVAPVYIEDEYGTDPSCADLEGAFGGGQTWAELEAIDGDPTVGTFDEITITAVSGQTFSWTSSVGVDAVLIKAGSDNHALYVYAPTAASSESLADTDLTHGPDEPATDRVLFCYDASPTPTPDVTPAPTPDVTPAPTPTPTPVPSDAPTEASILIVTIDNNGTTDPDDDVFVDGASFAVYLDDGDAVLETGEDTVVFGPSATIDSMLDTNLLAAGEYWIVETVVPAGFVGTGPILVQLNTDPAFTCIWDYTGFVECSPNEGSVEGLSWTIVIVDNTPIRTTPSPSGGVEGATGTPGITLPPTDTLGAASAPAGGSWRLVVLGMAAIMAAALVLSPTPAPARKVDAED